jgi:hypothetical protein
LIGSAAALSVLVPAAVFASAPLANPARSDVTAMSAAIPFHRRACI